jgi:hypothetical protein
MDVDHDTPGFTGRHRPSARHSWRAVIQAENDAVARAMLMNVETGGEMPVSPSHRDPNRRQPMTTQSQRHPDEQRRQSVVTRKMAEGKQALAASVMITGERQELGKLVRLRAKVAQTDAKHRGAWVLTGAKAKLAARFIIEAEARLAINWPG